MGQVWKSRVSNDRSTTLFLKKKSIPFEYSPYDFFVKENAGELKVGGEMDSLEKLKTAYNALTAEEKKEYVDMTKESRLKKYKYEYKYESFGKQGKGYYRADDTEVHQQIKKESIARLKNHRSTSFIR